MRELLVRKMCVREVYVGSSSMELAAVSEALERQKISYRRKTSSRGRERFLVRRCDEAQARRLIQIQMNQMWRDEMRH